MNTPLEQFALKNLRKQLGEELTAEDAAQEYHRCRELSFEMDGFDPARRKIVRDAADYFQLARLLFNDTGEFYPGYYITSHRMDPGQQADVMELAWAADCAYAPGATFKEHFINTTAKTDRKTLEELLKEGRFQWMCIPLCLLPKEMVPT